MKVDTITTTTAIDWRSYAQWISWAVGWIYFAAWTASFYPQLLTNFRRRSVRGLAASFFPINILGYLCYTISTVLLLFSPVIREEYAIRYPNAPNPTTRPNDFAFALHALIVSSITYSQFFKPIWGYETGRKWERTKSSVWGIMAGCCVAILITTFLAVGFEHDPNAQKGKWRQWQYLDITTTLSLSKLLITMLKYIPQVILNYQNKSTVGFAIWQMLLDCTGGVLSLLQLGIDSALDGSWSGVKGNLVKAGLGVFSIVFDVIFITQHYYLYRGNEGPDQSDVDESETEGEADEETPLFGGSGR